MADTVPLTEAARRLKISWHRAWRHMLIGDLRGEKVDGRWVVRRADVERLAVERGSRRTQAAAAA